MQSVNIMRRVSKLFFPPTKKCRYYPDSVDNPDSSNCLVTRVLLKTQAYYSEFSTMRNKSNTVSLLLKKFETIPRIRRLYGTKGKEGMTMKHILSIITAFFALLIITQAPTSAAQHGDLNYEIVTTANGTKEVHITGFANYTHDINIPATVKNVSLSAFASKALATMTVHGTQTIIEEGNFVRGNVYTDAAHTQPWNNFNQPISKPTMLYIVWEQLL